MKETLQDLLNKTFIKLRSDYGFKRAFGSPEHDDGEYEELFNLSEIATMKEEEYTAYWNSIMYEMERQSALEYARDEGREEGIEIGKVDVAKKMKDKGMSFSYISLFTGLSNQQIAAH